MSVYLAGRMVDGTTVLILCWMMLARPSMNMSRLQSAQLKHACHHLFRCRNFALAWAMVAWWMIATRQIRALACQRKLSPNGVALMLLLALNGTLSFHAIKKREEQEDSTNRSDTSLAKLVRTAGWESRGVLQRQIRAKPWFCILAKRKNTN